MKNFFTTTVLLLVLLYIIPAGAQTKTITINGKVTSFEESLPLEGVSIQVKGTSTVTGTQADGSFSITVSAGDKVLQLTLPGYEKKEIPLTNAKEYDIVLKLAGTIAYKKQLVVPVAATK